MENRITIRQAEARDLDEIIRLTGELYKNERQNFSSDWNIDWVHGKGKKIISESIGDKDNFILVAESGDGIIAFLRGSLYWDGWMEWKAGKGAELWDIYIEEGFRRRSLGQEMMDQFLNWCQEKRADYVLVNVTAANSDAARFYRRFGFETRQTIMEKKIK
jgi:ribosomal protein S18 acetylase RimI-like enzyme